MHKYKSNRSVLHTMNNWPILFISISVPLLSITTSTVSFTNILTAAALNQTIIYTAGTSSFSISVLCAKRINKKYRQHFPLGRQVRNYLMRSQFTNAVINSFVYTNYLSHCMLCELVILLDLDVCTANL
jgi:membrane protease YdiL (CAAX protease family)